MTDSTEHRPEEKFPPALWTKPTEHDIAVLRLQNKGRRFDARLVFAVAARCSHGCPQVEVCYPASDNGTPFPTLFWLSCTHLSRLCGILESAQMISELEEIFACETAAVEAWHKRYAHMRTLVLNEEQGKVSDSVLHKVAELMDGYGVGGINWRATPFAAKCLHLQTATMLGMGYHPAESWLRSKIETTECTEGICLRRTGRGDAQS